MNFKLTASGRQTLPPAWEYDEMTWGSLAQPPILAGDRIICLTDKAVFALDMYTGELVANEEGRFPHRLGINRSLDEPPAPTHCRGIVYFMDRNKLIARQLSDGNIPTRLVDGRRVPRWTPPAITGVTSLNANDNVVVVTHAEPEASVSGFDPATGERLWKAVKVSAFSPGPVTATRDAIVFVSGGHLFAVNILSGCTRFDFAPGSPADPLSEADAPQVGEFKDKSIVVVTGSAVYGVDLYNGKPLWTYRAPGSSAGTQWYRPAISERYNRVVLANKNNEVFVLELTTGALQWQASVPNVEQVRIVGDKVYASGKGKSTELHVFNIASGKKKSSVTLEDPGQMGLMTGPGILFTPGEEHIRAFLFGDQNAMLFNGTSSHITVTAKGGQLNFRQNDFTIEAWICTTSGGEIVSGFPTGAGNEQHGFRVNVSDQGRLRFSIVNRNASSSFAASSALTNVADGTWHHVAVVRRGDGVEMYIDGISVEVNTAIKGSQALDINGVSAMLIGAFMPSGQPPSHFDGLIRELRVWDLALDAAKLQSRMQLLLTGMEPHMLGYWRLDEADVSELKNHVPRQVYTVESKDVGPFVTELALDESTFPYLLDQVKLQWPYAGHWSARGDSDIKTGPALDRSGVLAFGTGNMLFGVLESDGARAWSKATPSGTSAPVAGGEVFYCVTGREGMIAINAHTGDVKPVEGFDGLLKKVPTGKFLPAPAADSRYIAAASPDGEVWVVEKMQPAGTKATAWKWKAPATIAGDLSIYDKRIYLTAGTKLYQIDPATKKDVSVAKSGPYTVHGDSVFCQVSADRVVRYASSDLTTPLAFFDVPAGVVVNGFAASSDLDLLVVATGKGDLYGLTFATLVPRWTARIPAGTASSNNSLNAPSISDNSVFCTSMSGAVAAVNANTGEIRGLFFEPTSIKTAPLVDSGEIFFGCNNAPAEANLLDGALHSVVFGQTNVLRLGVDRTGAREAARSYVKVTQGSTLKLLGVWECCVEAWINTKEGGEILSIAPNADSRYGLRLWLDRDGKIHFTCVDLPDDAGASWERITSEASSSACDGKWHHVAVTRSGREAVTIYLDGVALPATTSKPETITQPALEPELKIFIGADATSPAPSNLFAGMIGEIRVWDTYLTATRINTRMHEKLVGNEPDLLAYWNFDQLTLQDGSRRGHDGKLEGRDSSAGYWLADLNFTHPAYPYIETTGRMLQEGSAGSEGQLANTIYQLTVVARKGDGTPLVDHDVRLWYVQHRGETGPDTIEAASTKGNAQLKAVASSHGDENSLVGTTGKDGKVVFRVTTKQHNHGPSLDVRPAFLPSNERYHVNVLIDSQKLNKPAPPRLDAQATLIQDYHWSPGDNVNEERDRQTWRAVITARNSDGRARSGERFQLWATEHCEVEVDGRAYPINPHNYQTFTADEKGELTVAIAANDIRAPKLSVWAGFMHRDERYLIPLDRAVHKDLSELSAEELTEPRMKNWSPDYDAKTDNESFVDKGYTEHAGKVANAIQHVMSVTQEPAPLMRAGAQKKRARLLQDRRNFGDVRSVEPAPASDGVFSLRTLKHIERELPLEPESFMQSVRSLAGFENSIGFMFSKDTLALEPVKSVRQLHTTLKMKPSPDAPKLLGNIFEDAWNAIESAAEAVWKEAKRIAIYIAETVTLVIEYADKVVQKVVQSVKEAVEAVVHIFKMIGKFIEDVVRFLTTLFDWGAILEAHEILKAIVANQMQAVKQILGRGSDDFARMITGVFTGKPVAIDTTKHPQLAATGSSTRASDPNPEVQAKVNSVPSKYVNDKMDEHEGEISYPKPSVTPSRIAPDQGIASESLALTTVLSSALSDPLGLSFAEIYDSIKELISGDMDKVILRLLNPLLSNLDKMVKVIDVIWEVVNAPIEIPFLSDLYEWITGHKLTLLDVTCLALGVITHVSYTVFAALTGGEIRTFAKDAEHLKHYQLTAPQFYGEQPVLQTKLLGDDKKSHDRALHWSYFVIYELYTIGAAMLKVSQVVGRGGEWKPKSVVEVDLLALHGLVSKTLLFTAGVKEEGWEPLDYVWNTALYAICVGLDLYTVFDAFFVPPKVEADSNFSRGVKVAVSIAGCVLLGLRIDWWVNNKSDQSALFQTRDILNSIAMIFTFDDIDLFIDLVGPQNATLLIGGETAVKMAAGCVHIAAVVES